MAPSATRGFRTSWVFVGLVAAGCGGAGSQATHETLPQAAEAAPAPLAPMPEVSAKRALSGPDGLKVQVVELADGTALIDIAGATSEITGKVLSYDVEQNGNGTDYQTQWQGRTWNVVVRRASRYGGDSQWYAYPPGLGEQRLTYEDEESERVDPAALYATHVAQERSGELEALSRFDRPREEADAEARLAKDAARAAESCGANFDVGVEWSTVSDAQLMEKSIPGYCGSLLSGLRSICGLESGKRFVASHVKHTHCRLDHDAAAESPALTLAAGTLDWRIHFELSNLDTAARDALGGLTPPGAARTLGASMERDQTVVCGDEAREHVVILGPRDGAPESLSYGDGATFHEVPTPRGLSAGWFLDPRQTNPGNNENFRGYDLRYYSHVTVETESPDAGCEVTCGTRVTTLGRLGEEDKQTVLDGAKYEPHPFGREPYALARDRRGIYYYVDRGTTEDTRKDFRVFRGKRGRLRPQAMRDVVSDSEGEIFATRGGRLRLLVDRENAEWITKQGAVNLKRLPLQDNYTLIFNELGVYLGQRLYTPCDDF